MITDEMGWAMMAVNNCGIRQAAFPEYKPFCDGGSLQPVGGCKCRVALEAVLPMIRAEVLEEAAKVAELTKERDEARALADHAEERHWHDGEPPKPQRNEWFIAETIHGDKVCLKALPEEWTYDYKTADETYIMARNIKRWMRFPDSHFIEPVPAAAIRALKGGEP